jgi:hypothetical protein
MNRDKGTVMDMTPRRDGVANGPWEGQTLGGTDGMFTTSI